MSLFQELKRRNVFRVGIAYVVGAWLLLQFTEVLSELLTLPEQVGPIVVTAVAAGLPLVLIFAWAFELTPEGLKREHEVVREESITPGTGRKLDRVIIAMLAVALAYFVWESRFAERPADASVDSAAPAAPGAPALEAAAGEATPRSIAVLPFSNRSRLEDDEFFVEGIHDDLLTNLARIGGLKVISRTSMMRYKETDKAIPEIAAELGVSTVLEGAVQRSGETVRINVQLIDARSDEHLWAEIFDRQLTAENLFAIQTEISEQIAGALKATLSPAEQEAISDRPTDNLAAYNAYLRGRQLMARRNSADLGKALENLERAVELDPEFALAWASLAETLELLPGYGTMNLLEARQRQEAAARRAIELNEHLGEGYVPLAAVHIFREEFDLAEAAFLEAIDLSPGYATAYQWYADFLTRWPHRYAESLELTRKAVELDPLSPILRLEVAEKLLVLGRFEEGQRQLETLLQQDPGFAPAFSMMAAFKQITGHFDENLHWLRKSTALDPGRIGNYVGEAFSLMDIGDVEGVLEVERTVAALDDEHWANGWVDIALALSENNYDAALETVRWVDQQTGRQPSFQLTFGFLNIIAGDYPSARESLEIAEPRFFERSTWREAIEEQNGLGCIYAWVMARTGDEAMGRDLLEATVDYLESELPRYVDHPDRFNYEDCYLMQGELDKAIEAYETRVAHGHYGGWWINTRMPWFEPLRGTPRFEAALQTIRDNNARQRANLERLEAEAGP